jgi:hypothetical protein
MSTLATIKEATTRLHDDEKKALSLSRNSLTAPELSAEDERRLRSALDKAVQDVEAAKGVATEEVRKLARSWAAE